MKLLIPFNLFLLFLVSFFISNSTLAQYYSSGDFSVNINVYGYHDVNNCSTSGGADHYITVNNSHQGDTFKINYPGLYGYNLKTEINTTGANPWSFTYSEWIFGSGDQSLNNQPGYANLYGMQKKYILTHFLTNQSAKDTLDYIMPSGSVYVTDPCIYKTVSGKAYIDENLDCQFNNTDNPINNIIIKGTSNVQGDARYTNSTGDYTLLLQETNMNSYTVALPNNYQFIFQSTACSPVSYTSTTLPQTGYDFSLKCADIDLYAYSDGPGRALPNKPFNIYSSVGNVGCTAASGQLKLKLDPRVVYSSNGSTNLPIAIIPSPTGDTLVWNFSNLSSLSNGAYWNAFNSSINVTPLTSVVIGDTLHFSYWSTIPSQDINLSNNQGSFNVEIRTAFDPNFKEVIPIGKETKGYIPLETEKLTYTIHFQNTGNGDASNIYVIDTLDASIDPSSLHIESTSHTMNPEWIGRNIVKFNFPQINLPYATFNEAKSHGVFTFSVRLKPSLPFGTEIKNRGFIYFDYNPAIITNYATNTLAKKPTINTKPITGLTFTEVNLNGELIDNGGAPIIEKGFCLSTSSNPTIANTVVLNTENSPIFTNQFSSLNESTIYYIRSFATNAMGTAYGDEINFITASTASLPNIYLNEQLKLYPNPTESTLTLQTSLSLKSVKIIGADGKLIQEHDLSNGLLKINVSNLESGTYFVDAVSFYGNISRLTFVKSGH